MLVCTIFNDAVSILRLRMYNDSMTVNDLGRKGCPQS
jgi:hypothetical protein